MVIDVAFTVEELAGAPLPPRAAVVIDVVRASTTIVTALAHGAAAIVLAATPEEATARAQAWSAGAPLLGGEREGAPPPGFEAGNSPAEYQPSRVRGRTVIFTTTNGTRALLAVSGASGVAVGGFVNAAAVVEWLLDQGRDPLLVCSGESGRFCLEDAVCAGLLVARLRRRVPTASLSDGARAAAILYERYASDLPGMFADATWAQTLVRQGRGADLAFCIAVDAQAVVPVLRRGTLVCAIDTSESRTP
jgi:2-phosphosulfolactate phosphatase